MTNKVDNALAELSRILPVKNAPHLFSSNFTTYAGDYVKMVRNRYYTIEILRLCGSIPRSLIDPCRLSELMRAIEDTSIQLRTGTKSLESRIPAGLRSVKAWAAKNEPGLDDALFDVIARNSSENISVLDLSNHSLSASSIRTFCTMNLPSLTTLLLNNNSRYNFVERGTCVDGWMSDRAYTAVEFICVASTLIRLELAGLNILSFLPRHLCENLKNLEVLDLSRNDIKYIHMPNVGCLPALKYLDVSHNSSLNLFPPVTTAGDVSFSSWFTAHSQLWALQMAGVSCGDDDLRSLINGFNVNKNRSNVLGLTDASQVRRLKNDSDYVRWDNVSFLFHTDERDTSGIAVLDTQQSVRIPNGEPRLFGKKSLGVQVSAGAKSTPKNLEFPETGIHLSGDQLKRGRASSAWMTSFQELNKVSRFYQRGYLLDADPNVPSFVTNRYLEDFETTFSIGKNTDAILDDVLLLKEIIRAIGYADLDNPAMHASVRNQVREKAQNDACVACAAVRIYCLHHMQRHYSDINAPDGQGRQVGFSGPVDAERNIHRALQRTVYEGLLSQVDLGDVNSVPRPLARLSGLSPSVNVYKKDPLDASAEITEQLRRAARESSATPMPPPQQQFFPTQQLVANPALVQAAQPAMMASAMTPAVSVTQPGVVPVMAAQYAPPQPQVVVAAPTALGGGVSASAAPAGDAAVAKAADVMLQSQKMKVDADREAAAQTREDELRRKVQDLQSTNATLNAEKQQQYKDLTNENTINDLKTANERLAKQLAEKALQPRSVESGPGLAVPGTVPFSQRPRVVDVVEKHAAFFVNKIARKVLFENKRDIARMRQKLTTVKHPTEDQKRVKQRIADLLTHLEFLQTGKYPLRDESEENPEDVAVADKYTITLHDDLNADDLDALLDFLIAPDDEDDEAFVHIAILVYHSYKDEDGNPPAPGAFNSVMVKRLASALTLKLSDSVVRDIGGVLNLSKKNETISALRDEIRALRRKLSEYSTYELSPDPDLELEETNVDAFVNAIKRARPRDPDD